MREPIDILQPFSILRQHLDSALHCLCCNWRNLSVELADLANETTMGLVGAKAVKKHVRSELVALIRGVLDGASYLEAEGALAKLRSHRLGGN